VNQLKPATYGQGHSLGNTKKIDCGSNTREICYAFSCEIGVSLFLSQVGHREAGSLTAKVRVSEAMSFLRHKEIYQSDEPLSERARLCGHALAHRLDEFPVGYSWRVALQQRPLPLRQPLPILQKPSRYAKHYFHAGQPRDGSVKHFHFSPRQPSHLAGFEATTYGRFSGDHRGHERRSWLFEQPR